MSSVTHGSTDCQNICSGRLGGNLRTTILRRSVPLAFVCPWRFSLVFDFGWGFLGGSAIAVDIRKGRSNTWPVCRFELLWLSIPLTEYCRGSHANDIRVALIVGLEGYRVFSMCNTYLLGGRLVTSLDMILYIAGLHSYTDSHRYNWGDTMSQISQTY